MTGPWEKYQEQGPWTKYQQPKQGLLGRAWSALQKPEQMSRQGLEMLAKMVPEGKITGNLPMDIARGTPRILANTLAQAAPGFISRGALLTGALAPGASKLIGRTAKAIAPQLEDWAGIRPSGALGEAMRDPSLIFSRGPKGARAAYQAAQAELPYEQTIFKGLTQPQQIVDKAVETFEKGGQLEPQEGLIARKSLDKIKKKLSEDAFVYYRNKLDQIAKSSEDIAKADPLHRRGLMAQSLRGLVPKNVGGRASPFKVGEALALGRIFGPLGKVAGLATSPLALGAGYTGLGALGRIGASRPAAITVQQLLDFLSKRNANPNPQ